MPSQKELRWSQLKVGILTLFALAALTAIIFILSRSTGGLFTRKLNLRAYFENANGLKVGAPVTLDGVTIGNVVGVRIVPHHDPDAVEVVCRVGTTYLPSLHTDSTVAINQAGVLGDAFIDISSVHATGPEPKDNATLSTNPIPGIQDVIRTSQDSIQSINKVVAKVGVLLDTLNSGKGTAGMLLNDPEVAKKISRTIDQLQILSANISSGKGTVGKLINDDDLYNRLDSTVAKLDNITTRLDNGEGSAGKLLKDEALYKNLNSAIANANELLANINSGKGSLGKLAKDPALANKVEETLTHLNGVLQGMQEGKGTLGQLAQNRSLYDNLDKTLNDTGQLITAIRKDPKTYLTIHVKVF
ncbi:MlaD family protein [Acidicapsa acidisoli]|uniref:MlaD family protein n=1 Tax=Acidicapsa acidisoli TaxID=1615681 RepID=UPI0021DFC21B|nr:MlaD family protein [Acidicapsa acidisoli]